MRLFYRCIRSIRNAGPVTVFEQAGPILVCCPRMDWEWGDLVGFGAKGCQRSTSQSVNIFTVLPQASGRVIAGMSEIRFCPWCGEEIEIRRLK